MFSGTRYLFPSSLKTTFIRIFAGALIVPMGLKYTADCFTAFEPNSTSPLLDDKERNS